MLRNAAWLHSFNIKWAETGGYLCLTYSNMSTNGNGETIQKNKGEMEKKRWSVSLKLRDNNDYGTGHLSTEWHCFFPNGGLRLLSLVDFACKHANTKCLLPCFTGSWPRLRSEEPKLTCRQFTPTINDFRNVRWYFAAVPWTEHEENRLLIIRCSGKARCRQFSK